MISEQDVLDEIEFCRKTKDLIKVKILIRELPDLNNVVVKKIFEQLNMTESSYAIPLLVHLLVYHVTLAQDYPQIYDEMSERILKTSELKTSFAKLQTVKEMSCFVEALSERDDDHTFELLCHIITHYTDRELIVATLRTMAELKNPFFAASITDFLYAEDFTIVRETMKTLSHCSTPLSIQALCLRAGVDNELDKEVIKSLANSNLPEAVWALTNFLTSKVSSSRNAARLSLARLKEVAVPAIEDLLEKATNNDTKIICINTLGETGVSKAVRPVRRFLQSHTESANVRFAVYEALGLLPAKAGAYTLTSGLTDPDLLVRTAAAKAVENLFDDFFEAGLVNLLKNEESPEIVVDAILTAQCKNVFLALLSNQLFFNLSCEYFTKNPAKEVLKYYTSLSKQVQHHPMEDHLLGLLEKNHTETNIDVCVVDDSRLLLKIYSKMLTSAGVSFELFEFAESALESIGLKRPSLILTDLNMPGMNGCELTREIRKMYTSEELPVVMVTTQEEGDVRDQFKEIGIQEYLLKPFDENILVNLIEKYVEGL